MRTVLHHEVEGEILDEELAVILERLSVEGVEHRVPGAVLHAGAAVGLPTVAELKRLATEGALIDLAVVRAGERHAVVLQLDDCLRCNLAHVVDGILVAEPVGALHGVVPGAPRGRTDGSQCHCCGG